MCANWKLGSSVFNLTGNALLFLLVPVQNEGTAHSAVTDYAVIWGGSDSSFAWSEKDCFVYDIPLLP